MAWPCTKVASPSAFQEGTATAPSGSTMAVGSNLGVPLETSTMFLQLSKRLVPLLVVLLLPVLLPGVVLEGVVVVSVPGVPVVAVVVGVVLPPCCCSCAITALSGTGCTVADIKPSVTMV